MIIKKREKSDFSLLARSQKNSSKEELNAMKYSTSHVQKT
jgi:hypothetical protein